MVCKSVASDERRSGIPRLLRWAGGCVLGTTLLAGFLAYFVERKDPVTHRIYDGLGRALSDSPLFIRLVFGQDQLWAGWTWFGIDMLVFWGGLGLGAALMKRAADQKLAPGPV
jgi:hypothetical protein